MIQIDAANRIIIDGRDTGLALTQRRDSTVVYTPENAGANYREHAMPHARYSAAHDAPASGAAGRGQLEADIRRLLASEAAHDAHTSVEVIVERTEAEPRQVQVIVERTEAEPRQVRVTVERTEVEPRPPVRVTVERTEVDVRALPVRLAR